MRSSSSRFGNESKATPAHSYPLVRKRVATGEAVTVLREWIRAQRKIGECIVELIRLQKLRCIGGKSSSACIYRLAPAVEALRRVAVRVERIVLVGVATA